MKKKSTLKFRILIAIILLPILVNCIRNPAVLGADAEIPLYSWKTGINDYNGAEYEELRITYDNDVEILFYQDYGEASGLMVRKWDISLGFYDTEEVYRRSTFGVWGVCIYTTDYNERIGSSIPPMSVGYRSEFSHGEVYFTQDASDNQILNFNCTFTNITLYPEQSNVIENNITAEFAFHILHNSTMTSIKIDTFLDINNVTFTNGNVGDNYTFYLENRYFLGTEDDSILPEIEDNNMTGQYLSGAQKLGSFNLSSNYDIVTNTSAVIPGTLDSSYSFEYNVNGNDWCYWGTYFPDIPYGNASEIIWDPEIIVFTSSKTDGIPGYLPSMLLILIGVTASLIAKKKHIHLKV
ncbi:MAG: hypothetical protein GF364_18840 [Candidatus Lokiarchaeota archaeon]|nr:hypothetical protein [Candidatus Lokiarchaeota archaeon]